MMDEIQHNDEMPYSHRNENLATASDSLALFSHQDFFQSEAMLRCCIFHGCHCSSLLSLSHSLCLFYSLSFSLVDLVFFVNSLLVRSFVRWFAGWLNRRLILFNRSHFSPFPIHLHMYVVCCVVSFCRSGTFAHARTLTRCMCIHVQASMSTYRSALGRTAKICGSL